MGANKKNAPAAPTIPELIPTMNAKAAATIFVEFLLGLAVYHPILFLGINIITAAISAKRP
ncbi:hypothetical protein GCM10020331_093660 [Ectobacillus funiculus]